MRYLVFVLMLAVAPPAMAQSWCSSSGLSPTERTICSDTILGDLDARLGQAYRAAPQTDALREEQRRWIGRRDGCGMDVFCIEAEYRDRIAALSAEPSPPPAAGPLRPWCTASSLNQAERTVCGSETLSNMDAAMEAVYGRLRARDSDRSQIEWLDRRNACGGDETCIGQAYLSRIIELGGRLRSGG